MKPPPRNFLRLVARDGVAGAGELEAMYEGALARRDTLPAATLQAAEYLVGLGDVERLRAWLEKHTREERIAILDHLEGRQRR